MNQRYRTVREGPSRKIIFHTGVFDEVISLENLFLAWTEFRKGKRSKLDVQAFELQLEDNIFALHEDLVGGDYLHGGYHQFRVSDPKPRVISKASVRDRLLHRAIYRVLYPLFDKTFIFDSYSCRNNKGTHKAFQRLTQMTRKISENYTRPCYALKCDIRKFFDSIDHEVLFDLLKNRIEDEKLLKLLWGIIGSFECSLGRGMPLGNLTSQLFANIYMDPLDKFVKHRLKVRFYIRYADDFVFLGYGADELMGCLVESNCFLKTRLKLIIHPNKIYFRKLKWGIDYVGYVALPYYCLPRQKTITRIKKRIGRLLDSGDINELLKAIPSYLGYFGHANSYKLQRGLLYKITASA